MIIKEFKDASKALKPEKKWSNLAECAALGSIDQMQSDHVAHMTMDQFEISKSHKAVVPHVLTPQGAQAIARKYAHGNTSCNNHSLQKAVLGGGGGEASLIVEGFKASEAHRAAWQEAMASTSVSVVTKNNIIRARSCKR